jgi:hypothetical protein
MKLEAPMKLSFTLEEENNALSKVFIVDFDTEWTELVLRFTDFLSAHYGYNLKEQIAFVSNFTIHDKWSEIGERTISSAAYLAAQDFDEMQEEEEFE